jgi:hypothetical protein
MRGRETGNGVSVNGERRREFHHGDTEAAKFGLGGMGFLESQDRIQEAEAPNHGTLKVVACTPTRRSMVGGQWLALRTPNSELQTPSSPSQPPNC